MMRCSYAGSLIGSIKETQEMLDFCGKHNITPLIETIAPNHVNEAYGRVLKSDARCPVCDRCREIENLKNINGNILNTQLKRKIAFALSMGAVTTGIISFTLVALNVGLSDKFALIWLRSWGVAYLLVIPVIPFIGPCLQNRIERVIH